jgi:hypothetical protein
MLFSQRKETSMLRSHVVPVMAGLITVGTLHGALAQQTDGPTGWTFRVAPYLWLPTIDTTINYSLPPLLGGRAPTEVSAGPGNYIPNLHFATAFAAEARYDRFSLLTDFMYVSVGTSASRVKEVDFFGQPAVPLSRSSSISIGTNIKSVIWSLAGGYTVAEGDWGNVEVIAGFRYLGVDANTNYNLAVTVTGPQGGGGTFGGAGNLSGSKGIWNGIGGVHGRIRLADTGLFIPYYFDIGAGGSKLTWQVASGLGYQAGWAGVSLTYRYLSLQQSNSSLIDHIRLGGPMMAVSFDF